MIKFNRKKYVVVFRLGNMSKTINDVFDNEPILERGIEFVGVIGKNGRLVDCKKDQINLSDEQNDLFCMTCQLSQMMNQDFDDDFGKVQYTITERENYRIVAVPQYPNTLIFVMDKHGKFFTRVKKLMKSINHFKNLKSNDEP